MFYSLLITLESVLLQVCKKPIELVLQDLFRWNDAISVLPALPTKSASLVICVNSLLRVLPCRRQSRRLRAPWTSTQETTTVRMFPPKNVRNRRPGGACSPRYARRHLRSEFILLCHSVVQKKMKLMITIYACQHERNVHPTCARQRHRHYRLVSHGVSSPPFSGSGQRRPRPQRDCAGTFVEIYPWPEQPGPLAASTYAPRAGAGAPFAMRC